MGKELNGSDGGGRREARRPRVIRPEQTIARPEGWGMLVIGRRAGEVVWIDDDVAVVVVEVLAGGRVRLGVMAPKDVPVLRGELVPGHKLGEELPDRIERGGRS